MSDTGRIAIVYNAHAGKRRSGKMAREIASMLDNRSVAYVLVETPWPTDFSSFSAVWIIGGDGTLNYFINHVKGELPPLAIFKGGTGNDFATLLYGNMDMHAMVDHILKSSGSPVDAGICNGRYFVNIAGIGFEGDVLRHMDTIRWMGAFWGYYLAVIRVIFSFREPIYMLRINGGDEEVQRLLLLMISNAPETGGGFRVSPKASVQDGLLDLVRAKPLGILQRMLALPKVRKGEHLDLPFVQHQTLRKISIQANREMNAQLDGEQISSRRFEITIVPSKFQFLY